MTDVDQLLARFRALTGNRERPAAVESVEHVLANAQAQPTSEGVDERVIREGIRLSGLVGAATEEVHDGSQGETTEDESEEQDDELNQDEVLRRALDEAAVEREQAALDGDQGGNRPEGVTRNDLLEASLFPMLPTHIPEPEPEPEPELDPIFAKLQALNASTAAPVVNPKPASGPGAPAKAFNYSLPGFDLAKDDDLTSWCCICNQDGEIQCSTCDDDVYCSECFASSHGTGPGQERGHRFGKYKP